MAATASSGLKQHWRPSRGRGQSRNTTDPSLSSSSGVHSASKDLGLEKASTPLPSSSSSSPSSSSSTMVSSSFSSSSASSLPMAASSNSSSSLNPASSANKLFSNKSSFVPYLPHDDAIAAGLGADQGGIDAAETQRVADLLNQELGRLLRMRHVEFWKAVTMDSSIEVSLDSYLQFRRRWYDFNADGGSKPLAGVIVGDQELFRRVFMVLYRMSLRSENRARPISDNSLADEHAEVIFQRRFFDVPKLLDICAIYGNDNEDLTRQLVKNAFAINEGLFDDLRNIVPVISKTVCTMQQRCLSTLNMQLPTNSELSVVARIRQELLEVLEYLNDAVISLSTFVNAYSEGALVLILAGHHSDSKDQILLTLETMHDSLIPTVRKCFLHLQGHFTDTELELAVQTRSKRLRFSLIDLVWRLFCFSYLEDSSHANNQDSYVNYLLETHISNPKARGEGFVQVLSLLVDESSNFCTGEITYAGVLLRNIDRKYKLLERIDQLRKKGLMSLDTVQYDYVEAIISQRSGVTSASLSNYSELAPIDQELSEADVLNESKISHIKDILPEYGAGFIAACLEAYDNNPEEVIQRILEGTLHPTLQSLDTTLEAKSDSRNSSLPAKDKGKGKVDEAPLLNRNNLVDTETRAQKTRWQGDTNGLAQRRSSSLSASSSSLSENSSSAFPKLSDPESVRAFKGRFVRKDKGEANVKSLLDEHHADDVLRTAAYAAQYEDEYDDSFDDLGTSIADGVEETEILVDLARSKPSVGGDRGSSQDSRLSVGSRNAGIDRWGERGSSQDNRTSGGNRSAGLGRGVWAANNGSNQEAKATIVRETGVGNSQRKGQPPVGRGRGRGRRNEPRGQFYVKDGMNYSYKVAGSVAVASVDEAEALKTVEKETIHGLSQGGNVPISGDQVTQGSSQTNLRPGRGESSDRRGAQSRGRGAPRTGNDHHHRKDRAMQKHFASLGGM